MASLRRELRKELENAATAARNAAVTGARKAIEALAVQSGKPWPTMSEEQKQLRNRLRAHSRQLGDLRNQKQGDQSIEHLVQECAYEHWHRMLFARFLAESDLLIEPESGVAISLDECREWALERGIDWMTLASEFAVKMLSQIFRAGDPVLEVSLPLETRQELEGLLKALPGEVFLAEDSLGWVYQFWQADKKKEVNDTGEKIGADELAPVTQLFTDDYMVLFLLHNSIGAWWAGKVLAQRPDLAMTAESEDELRAACAIGDISWQYLRFVREGEGPWRPAAGKFGGWPAQAKNLRVLDPCMGSGHFLVFALPMLVTLRMIEENVSREDAVHHVLSDNLFGLELDNRCTQIAAFNLALSAWRMVGHRYLPPLNLACSGLGINAKEEEWIELAGKDQRLRDGMRELYQLFKKGTVLGSLINPRALNRPAPLLIGDYHAIQPHLEAALGLENRRNYEITEMAIAAQGIAKAAEILADQFTLVATNVPYLGATKQDGILLDYCERVHPEAKSDLATCFVERCLAFCSLGGSTCLVTPQNWLFLSDYSDFRKLLLRKVVWHVVVRMGEHSFESASAAGAFAAMAVLENVVPTSGQQTATIDVSALRGQPPIYPAEKALLLVEKAPRMIPQAGQIRNPDSRIVFTVLDGGKLLQEFVDTAQGIKTGDDEKWRRTFWELPTLLEGWKWYQTSVRTPQLYGGASQVIDWRTGGIGMVRPRLGNTLQGRSGVAISPMGPLPAALYLGERFESSIAPLVAKKTAHLLAIWAFTESEYYRKAVRAIDQKLCVTTDTLAKVPFDLAHWQKASAEKYPNGLPKPFSSDPTQWLFNGQPQGSDHPLHVAVARLLGYQWPRQTGSSFPDCPALSADDLEKLVGADGIVCLDALQGDLSASERLRALLSSAYGREWSPTKQAELLDQVGAASLEAWLREKFFEQHCSVFHNRPFAWHIWDGLRNGFHALVNYHRLAAPNGQGRRTLEKLIYSYLGDWIKQQRDDQRNGVEGADARVAAAEHLKKQLELILHGDPPYDLFVRWKALHEQPIGWDPDINDGVRQNIRPFITATPLNVRSSNACLLRVMPRSIQKEKDRGKEPYREKQDFPWFWTWDQSGTVDFIGGENFDGNRWNDLHYSPKFKQSSRERNSVPKKAQKR